MKNNIFPLLLLSFLCNTTNATEVPYTNEFSTKADDVSVTVRTLIDTRSSSSVTKRYYPLEVEIKNNGAVDYYLSQENFSLPVTSLQKVSKHNRARFSLAKPIRVILTGFVAGFGIGFFGAFLGFNALHVAWHLKHAAFSVAWHFNHKALQVAWYTGVVAGSTLAFFGAAKNLQEDIKAQYENKDCYKERGGLYPNACDLETALIIPAHTSVKKVLYVRKSKYKYQTKYRPQFNIALEKVAPNN